MGLLLLLYRWRSVYTTNSDSVNPFSTLTCQKSRMKGGRGLVLVE
jgi:hypothetical protein